MNGANGGVHVAVGTHHYNRGGVALIAQGLQDFQAADPRQAQICDHQVKHRSMAARQRFLAGFGNLGLIPFGREGFHKGRTNGRFIVDDQDPWVHVCSLNCAFPIVRLSLSRGNRTRKKV